MRLENLETEGTANEDPSVEPYVVAAAGERQRLGGSAIHLAPVTDLDDEHDALGIVERVHHVAITLPDPASIQVSRQFLTTWRARVTGESFDSFAPGEAWGRGKRM
jgi:hypothetical protein